MRCICAWNTGEPADCAAHVSLGGEACVSLGTYVHDAAAGARMGCLRVHRVADLRAGVCAPLGETPPGPGVYDALWLGHTAALAQSDGTIALWDWAGASFTPAGTIAVEKDAVLTSVNATIDNSLVASTATGRVYSIADSIPALVGTHRAEVWTAAPDAHRPHVVHAGDDLGVWLQWDARQPADKPVSRVLYHSAGVCCIAPHPSIPNLIATTSYDRRVALWDPRTLAQPLAVWSQEDAGVWRAAWRGDMLLLACTFAGACVLRVADDHAALAPVGRGAPQDTAAGRALTYGAAWVDDATAVTSSFYACTAHLWDVRSEHAEPE